MSAPKRVLIVDRRRMVREGLVALFDEMPEFVPVSGETGSPTIAGQIDIVLLGPGERLPGDTAEAAVVRFADHDPFDAVVDMCRMSGGSPEGIGPHPPTSLTPREIEVVRGIADGLAARQIAAILGISVKSVDNHKQRIFTKLAVSSQAHAVAVVLDAGLMRQDQRCERAR